MTARRIRAVLVNAALAAASVLIALAAIEGLIGYALSHPEILAASGGGDTRPLALARNYYMRKDRRIVQYLPECARYDSGLAYTLKPGECAVANREHRTLYRINNAGLRDDEAALARPAVVVTGDSHALGWGVERDEALARRLGRLLGVKVLNAAQSSYGTAREMKLLERLDLSAAKAIVIQYCNNDYDENRAYAATGALDIMAQAKYEALVAEHAREARYYPFKYVRNLFSIGRFALPWYRGKPPELGPTKMEEARAFLDVLLRHEKILAGRAVVVTEINPVREMDPGFIAAARALIAEPRYASLAPSVGFVDLSAALTPADYWTLDDHMRPSGHAKAALAIAEELKRRGMF